MEKKFFLIVIMLVFIFSLMLLHYFTYPKKNLFLSYNLSLIAKMPLISFESSIYEQNAFLTQSALPKINPIYPLMPTISTTDFVYER